MIVTEKEAREKWCPFSRLANPARASTFNRVAGTDLDSGPMIAAAVCCIASQCMAWRFVEEVEEAEGSRFTVRKRGYCGLALSGTP